MQASQQPMTAVPIISKQDNSKKRDSQQAPLLMSLLAANAPKGSVNLGLGEPLYETPDSIMEQWFDLLRNDQVGYGPDPGLPELRREIAAMHRVEVERVIVTCGASEALACALATIIEPGDEVIIPDPAFVAYDPLIRMLHGKPVAWPLLPEQDFLPDLNLLSRLITKRTRAILVNNPHNPTGTVYPATTLKALANFADAHGIQLISDEVYRHLTYDSPAASMASVSGKAIVISSFSKLFKLAGHRVGWAITESPEAMLAAHLNLTFRAPTPSQQLALLAMRADRTGLLNYYADNRETLSRLLLEIDGLKFVKPAGTFFLWVDVSAYGSSWEIATRALEKGVVVAPNSGPGRGFGDSAPNYVRLSFAAETADLEQGVERFKQALVV